MDLSDMPSPTQVVALLESQNVRHVRLYDADRWNKKNDADRAVLLVLANTGIQVTVSVPNELLLGIGQSNATAANWVARNIISHIPATNITEIAVGSEVLTALLKAAPVLVSALKFIHPALVASNLDIYRIVPYAQRISVLRLHAIKWRDPIGLCTFPASPPDKEAVDANTLLHYTNVFDAIVDAAYFSISYLNVTNVPIVVTKSGWPSKGDSSEPDATVENANTYNSNLIKHVINNTGTPKHPGIAVSTYIYELYNEDLIPGPASEQNWGLFDANGVPVHILHLTGAGKVACSPLLQGRPCYEPDNVVSHSTYAFNVYFQRIGKSIGTCDFKGVATITTTDPSHVSCVLPGSFGENGTITNGTSLAPSSNDTNSGHPPQYFYRSDSFTISVIIGVCVFHMATVFL
ncbi:Glucan endo-1,3-beta-glucosidase 3 [Hibiscus syriacus]|uniref:glucan endo-1,3-beta-D-glucosidase n=1 Tax=Hibiscus syriacus TaxID=106335 RepID=A0A6A3B3R3_HIBSY|nr:Glucan endo-1,3-beta-glucosidase 3 [Hibiscus syriacus]